MKQKLTDDDNDDDDDDNDDDDDINPPHWISFACQRQSGANKVFYKVNVPLVMEQVQRDREPKQCDTSTLPSMQSNLYVVAAFWRTITGPSIQMKCYNGWYKVQVWLSRQTCIQRPNT